MYILYQSFFENKPQTIEDLLHFIESVLSVKRHLFLQKSVKRLMGEWRSDVCIVWAREENRTNK